MIQPEFERSAMLLGEEKLEKLSRCRVAIFGLGGVGGAALEALARSGIGEFHLIDADSFALSNINRQLLASHVTIGQKKVDIGKQRILQINENAKVFTYPTFYLPGDTSIPFDQFDIVIDAIDTVSAKTTIAEECHLRGIPEVMCLGMGNRMDPSKVHIGDLYETSGDPLAKIMRKKCRELGINSLPVVYSVEEPMEPLFKVESDSPSRRDVPGSLPFVPPVAGYSLAYEAVRILLEKLEA